MMRSPRGFTASAPICCRSTRLQRMVGGGREAGGQGRWGRDTEGGPGAAPLTSGSPSCYCPGPETGGRGGAGWPARLRGAGAGDAGAGGTPRGRPERALRLRPGPAGAWKGRRDRGAPRAPLREARVKANPFLAGRGTPGCPQAREPAPPQTWSTAPWPRDPCPTSRARPGPSPPPAPRSPGSAHSPSPAGCCPRRGPAPRASRPSPWLCRPDPHVPRSRPARRQLPGPKATPGGDPSS